MIKIKHRTKEIQQKRDCKKEKPFFTFKNRTVTNFLIISVNWAKKRDRIEVSGHISVSLP